MNEISPKHRIVWAKALWNGLLALILGYVIFMLPAFFVAFKMGFELGPKMKDSQAVSSQISQKITAMYEHSWLLIGGFILVTTLLIIWRSWAVSKNTGEKRTVNGILVSAIPVVVSLFFFIAKGFRVSGIIEVLGFFGAGILGSRIKK